MANKWGKIFEEDPEELYEILVEKTLKKTLTNKQVIEILETFFVNEEFDFLAEFVEDALPENEHVDLFHEIIEYSDINKELAEELVALVCERELMSEDDLELVSTWNELIWNGNSDDYIRSKCGTATAATNPRTSVKTLLSILENCNGKVRYRIAANPASDFQVLRKIVQIELGNFEGYELLTNKCSVFKVFTRSDLKETEFIELRSIVKDIEILEAIDKLLSNREDVTLNQFLLW